jgi:cytochrome c553
LRLAAAFVLISAVWPAFGQTVEKRFDACAACHGKRGTSEAPLTPSLGAQPSFFVMAQLFLFREGRRDHAAMTEAAKGLSDADLRAFGALVAGLPPPGAPAGGRDPAKLERAAALLAQRNCAGCHGADFSGGEQVPRLANQREDFLLKAMRDYRSGRRIGYGNALMPETVAGLSDADLAALAHFLASIPARPGR